MLIWTKMVVDGLKSGRFEREMLEMFETDEWFVENSWLINRPKFASYQIFDNYKNEN